MANRFTFTLHAVDQTTRVFKKIDRTVKTTSKLFGGMSSTFKEGSKSASAFGNDTFSAFRKAGEEIDRTSSSAFSFARVLGPMAGLVGTVAAGALYLAKSWGAAGISVTNTAARFGGSVGQLQAWIGLAKKGGLSTDAMQQSLIGLGDTLRNIDTGNDQTGAMLLSKIGVTAHKGKDGVVDVTRALLDLSNVFARMKNPQAEAVLANAMGISPELLPLMRQGSAELQRQIDLMTKLGVANEAATKKTEALGKAWGDWSVRIDGVMNRIKEFAAPTMTKILDASAPGSQTKLPGLWGMLQDIGNGKSGAASSSAQRQGGGPFPGYVGPSQQFNGWKESPEGLRNAGQAQLELMKRDGGSAAEVAAAQKRAAGEYPTGAPTKIDMKPQHVIVDVNLSNAPPGTTASARSNSGQNVPVRVTRTMPTGSSP